MITLRHTTVGRTPLDECSAQRRDLYLTTYNTHKRQTFMLLAGFESTIPASELPQNYAVDRAATGNQLHYLVIIPNFITISSELRTASSVRLGDLTENTSWPTVLRDYFRSRMHFARTVFTFSYNLHKAANFSIKSINYFEFAMKPDCVPSGRGTEYPQYLSIHVSQKSHGIERQCISKICLTLQSIQLRNFPTIFRRIWKKYQRFEPDHVNRDADKLLVNDAFGWVRKEIINTKPREYKLELTT